MSAITTTTPDTPITVRVSYAGETRRLKLALKDVGPLIFPGKLRELLAIPDAQIVKFERYSDSAASYVTLDPENTGVYKQLYRAAKAKQKLRIKVTNNVVEGAAPDAEAASVAAVMFPPSYSTVNVDYVPATATSPSVTSVDPALLDSAVAKAVNSHFSSSEFTSQLRDTVREEVEKRQPEQSDLISMSKTVEAPSEVKPVEDLISSLRNANLHCTFDIYCNSCHDTINGLHYHCDKCDYGDYDLCKRCFTEGLRCKVDSHNMFGRERVDCKPALGETTTSISKARICNCCVGRFRNDEGIVCLDCKDYDLCVQCLRDAKHGHDPRHRFARVNPSLELSDEDEALLEPGRGVHHAALCDSCEATIIGVRHKCIDCPDWDYCSNCVLSSPEIHPGHRFVPIIDNDAISARVKAVPLSAVTHAGVYCDGPICARSHGACIRGPRFKCAICPDTDFCGTCEASPLNPHNTSHPLVKIKTPIRHMLVTTSDSDSEMTLGDAPPTHVITEKVEPATTTNTATQVQTIADVKPTEEFATLVEPVKIEKVVEVKPATVEPKVPEVLEARYRGDTIADGTLVPVGDVFTQTWYMENTGPTAWPAGVTVKFVGGDYMFRLNNEDAVNATLTTEPVLPGQTASFSVKLNATWPANKMYISYWRLNAPDGRPFGDNIWCSINVTGPEPKTEVDEEAPIEDKEDDRHSEAFSSESVADADSVKDMSIKGDKEEFESATENLVASQTSSQMVFPKLPVESPIRSLEHLPSAAGSVAAEEQPVPASPGSDDSHKTFALSEDDDCGEEIDISSIGDSDGFMTDEEYYVLCASDEEFEDVA